MSIALYRKYRPSKFSEVEGQNHIKITLQNELEMDTVSHAYLFSGPRGTGKTTLARLLAKAVNCTQRKKRESEPCCNCDSCREISEGRSIDIVEIDAASHTGVDNVRENIIQNSKYTPTKSKFKIFIIDEVHMLSISAFNALLKTLEEPPKHAMFILATTELYKVPQTIISRCQRFDFKKLSVTEIKKRLGYIIRSEKKDVDDTVVDLVAQRADGCIRDAESMLEQIFSLNEKKITLDQARLIIPYSDFHYVFEFISFLRNCQMQQGIDFINRVMYEGVDLERFCDDVIEGLRKILLLKLNGTLDGYSFDLPKDQEANLLSLSRDMSIQKIVFMIEVFIDKKAKFALSAIVQLPLEMAIIEICDRESNPPDHPRGNDGAPPPVNTGNATPSGISEKEKVAPEEKTANRENKPSLMSISFDAVVNKWNEILSKVKQYNHTLFSFLCIDKPIKVEKDTIQLGVCYKFHKERIDELKNKLALEGIIEEILGKRMRVECIVLERKQVEPDFVKADKALDAIVQEFGGRVVE